MAARDRRRRRAPRPGPAAAATPPPSRDRRSLRRGPGPGRAAAAALDARRLLPLLHQRERLLALLAPGIELVRLEARLPRLLRLRLVTREPVRAAQLVMGLDQVRPELQRLLQKGLGVLVHLDRKSTRLNSSHSQISYAVFCLKKKQA